MINPVYHTLLHPFASIPVAVILQPEPEPELKPAIPTLEAVASGELFRNARLRLGLTQQALADFSQVALSTIARGERGERLRSDSVSLLCQFFSERFHRAVMPEEIGLLWNQKHRFPANHALRAQREKRGWSQTRLAELLNADPTMVNRWESGERKPAHFYREKLCTLFETTADILGLL